MGVYTRNHFRRVVITCILNSLTKDFLNPRIKVMQKAKDSDRKIIAMLKNRDKQAIDLIITLYGNKLYGYIFHYQKSEKLAAEVMKKAFVNIWNYSLEYDKAPDYFFIWLLRIVKETMEAE